MSMKKGKKNKKLLANLKRELRTAIAMGNPKLTPSFKKALQKVRSALNIKPNKTHK